MFSLSTFYKYYWASFINWMLVNWIFLYLVWNWTFIPKTWITSKGFVKSTFGSCESLLHWTSISHGSAGSWFLLWLLILWFRLNLNLLLFRLDWFFSTSWNLRLYFFCLYLRFFSISWYLRFFITNFGYWIFSRKLFSWWSGPWRAIHRNIEWRVTFLSRLLGIVLVRFKLFYWLV